jgi:1,2-diacylglycerol 3-alpha-glucosyltransferase
VARLIHRQLRPIRSTPLSLSAEPSRDQSQRVRLKVVHACLSNWYVDGYGYQENELIRTHVVAGHEVVVVASTEVVSEVGGLEYLQPETFIGAEGAPVTRLAYVRWFPPLVARKIRAYRGLRSYLAEQKPDVIFFHGCAAWALMTVGRYAKSFPDVIFNVDSHEDYSNSARTALARLLHQLFYAPVARRISHVAKPILCVTTSTMDFLEELYRLDRSSLEFFPIGGHVDTDDEYDRRRSCTRAKLELSDSQRLFVQSGKFTQAKRLSWTVEAFRSVDDPSVRLAIAGSFTSEDMPSNIRSSLTDDPRIAFLGWKSPEELRDLLCAADVYVQPGTQSATMQQSLCSRCAVILNEMPSHRPYVGGNGWLVRDKADLIGALRDAANPETPLEQMKIRSYEIARRLVDYQLLAERAIRKP